MVNLYPSQSNMFDKTPGVSVRDSCSLGSAVPTTSLLRLRRLEPEPRWHFIYINNYWPESPPGLPRSNQTSNALKIAQHVLLMDDYKMYCYIAACTLFPDDPRAMATVSNFKCTYYHFLFLQPLSVFYPNYSLCAERKTPDVNEYMVWNDCPLAPLIAAFFSI